MKKFAMALCAAGSLLIAAPALAQPGSDPMEANAKMGKFRQMSGAPMNSGNGGMYNRRGRGHMMMGKGRMHGGMMHRRRGMMR